MKEKFEYISMIELKNGEDTKVDDTGAHKPPDNTSGDDGVFKQSAAEMEDSSTTSRISPEQSEKQFTEEIIDPITTVEHNTADSIAETNVSFMNESILHELLQKKNIYNADDFFCCSKHAG